MQNALLDVLRLWYNTSIGKYLVTGIKIVLTDHYRYAYIEIGETCVLVHAVALPDCLSSALRKVLYSSGEGYMESLC